MLIFLVALGVFCVSALWGFEAWSGLIAEVDRYGYPYLLSLFAVCLCVLVVAPQHHSRVLIFGYTGFALYFVVVLSSSVMIDGAAKVYTVANVLQWMPILYVSAFVFFRARAATRAALAVFVLSLAPALFSLFTDAAGQGDFLVFALLVNAYAVHLLIVLCLSLVGVLREHYEQASRRAFTFEVVANTDQLTGVANRRGVAELIPHIDRGEPGELSIVLFDLDHFKRVNDAYGHAVGDAILSSSATLIRSQLGERDILGRWGGEEFIVIVHTEPPDGAEQFADRVRTLVNASVHPIAGAVTVSAGIARWAVGQEFDDVLRRADRALYRAKARGRNCTEVAVDEEEASGDPAWTEAAAAVDASSERPNEALRPR